MPLFDCWDLAPVTIPPRSRLHSIPPIGLGTPFVESLTGYMVRLATSHAVRVSDLIEHELSSSVPYFRAPAGISRAINGVGASARNWVSAVERFTLRDDLRFLTLLPLAAVLNDANLMRSERAWCPRCYESSATQGQEVYEQLIWCVRCVEICPLHKIPLETSCPACHHELRPLCAVSRPGICSRCRQWLGTTPESPKEVSGMGYQVWVAEEFGRLLAIGPEAEPVRKENIRKVLLDYVDAFSEGNRIATAEIVGCATTAFCNWCKGATIARIDLLLRMCYELRIPLRSAVTGSITAANTTAIGLTTEARRRRGIRPRRSADRARPELLLATKEYPAPSLGEVAQRLGYSTPDRLYAADSELCKTIVRRFNKSGRSRWWKKRGAKSPDHSIIRKALEESLALDMPLAVHRSAAALGYQTEDALTARFPDLCRAIKTKRAKVRAARRSAVATELEAALGADPPPTVLEVARRLGYKGASVLRETEPELCAKFVARRREIVEDSRREFGRRLEAVLQENPPPSMSQVRARFGITPSTMRRRFLEIQRAIAARRQEFRDSTIQNVAKGDDYGLGHNEAWR